jgi:hypothetical protein
MAEKMYDCRVHGAGAFNKLVQINLSDTADPPAFTERWFTAVDGAEDRLLASALVALTSHLAVATTIDVDTGIVSRLLALEL